MLAPDIRKGRIDMHVVRMAAVALLWLAAGPTAASAQSPSSGGPLCAGVIEDLVAANRILAEQGVLDAYGHVSVRHPGNPDRYVISRAMSPANVSADDIMEFDLDSSPVDQRGRGMFLERFIHGEIYKARPDVNAVIHSHSPGVIPFGVTSVPMRPVFHTAAFLAVGVPVFEIRDAGGGTKMLGGNGAPPKAPPTTPGGHPGGLMRGPCNRGVGPDGKGAPLPRGFTARDTAPPPIPLG